MFKERVKTTATILLFVNLIVLTCRLWFGGGLMREEISDFARSLPVVGRLFHDEKISIPREMLSRPRKILINDGSLWIAYYNTDLAFSPIENRTGQIIRAFLRGETVSSKPVSSREWQAAIENVSIYVEMPIAYTTGMLCSVMGVDGENAPKDISAIRDFVILPSTGDTGVFLLVRDAYDGDNARIYQFPRESFSLPAGDLAIYTENNTDYYEPAFSTGVEPEGASLDPMVLFFDSRPVTADLIPADPIAAPEAARRVLGGFFKNVDTAGSYEDSGVSVFVENDGDARIYPGGLFEYRAVEDKGVELTESYSSYYETVNSAISFAEELWSRISDQPLSVLVSSDLTQDGGRIHITMDYYQNGRPVAVELGGGGFEPMDHGIEMDIEDGKIVSYRQLFRSYYSSGTSALKGDFVDALDYFVKEFSPLENPVITDIYIGYMDRGGSGPLSARWLAELSGDSRIYDYDGGETAENAETDNLPSPPVGEEVGT